MKRQSARCSGHGPAAENGREQYVNPYAHAEGPILNEADVATNCRHVARSQRGGGLREGRKRSSENSWNVRNERKRATSPLWDEATGIAM